VAGFAVSVFDGDGGITRAQAAGLSIADRQGAQGRWWVFNHSGVTPAGIDLLMGYWMPTFRPITPSLLRTRCQVAGAGSAIKWGVWVNDPVTGRPSGLPVISQNAGLPTTTGNTNQDQVVSGPTISSPSGWWFFSKMTGTLPTMICSLSGGASALAIGWPVGGAPTGPRGHLSIASSYATDIATENLTGAGLLEQALPVPCVFMEYA
jgi:hypothetical protein